MYLNRKGFVCLVRRRSSLLTVITGIARAVSFRRFPRDGADGQRTRCSFPAQWVESGALPSVSVLSDRGITTHTGRGLSDNNNGAGSTGVTPYFQALPAYTARPEK